MIGFLVFLIGVAALFVAIGYQQHRDLSGLVDRTTRPLPPLFMHPDALRLSRNAISYADALKGDGAALSELGRRAGLLPAAPGSGAWATQVARNDAARLYHIIVSRPGQPPNGITMRFNRRLWVVSSHWTNGDLIGCRLSGFTFTLDRLGRLWVRVP